MKRNIVVALSGGVDSAVAALLLKQQAKNEVIALHMANWNPRDEDELPGKCLDHDTKDAEAVCRHLSLPLHRVSFASEYWTGVFEPLVDGIASGFTPNPDVRCNSIIKFGAMKDYVRARFGVDRIATGHYARLWTEDQTQMKEVEESLEEHDWLYDWKKNDNPLLVAGLDKDKDQSYFLAGVKGTSFRNVEFPIGNLMKTGKDTTVRSIAQEASLPNASKRESMGICFVGKRSFARFISQYLPSVPQWGRFIDVDTGDIKGRHPGSVYFTIGQGAKISGVSQKWFVAGKDNHHNVIVCAGTHHPALYTDEMTISEMNWIGGDPPQPLQKGGHLRLHCRIRHLQPLFACEISMIDGSSSSYVVQMEHPIRAISPGQMAVFYAGEICLGGGIIMTRGSSYHERGLDLPPISNLHPSGRNDLSVLCR